MCQLLVLCLSRLQTSCSSHVDREIMSNNCFVQDLAFHTTGIWKDNASMFSFQGLQYLETVRKGSIHIKFMTKKKYSVLDKTTVNNRYAERKSI